MLYREKEYDLLIDVLIKSDMVREAVGLSKRLRDLKMD